MAVVKKQIVPCVALALCLAFLFSGCSLRFTALSNLLRPPKLTGVYDGLQEAFESYVGKNYLLKTPVAGDYRSAFIMYDVDSDEEEEAFVFYTQNKDQSTVRLLFMDSKDGEWIFHYDFPGAGSDVYSVFFADMDNDGISELIVGWGLFDSKESKVLTVYQYNQTESEPRINTLAREAFTVMLPVDIDRDGSKEIFLLAPETTGAVRRAVGKLLKMTDGAISLISTIPLDPKALNSVSLKKEDLGLQYPVRLYIDATVGASSMITEIIYWDSSAKKLVAPLFDEKKAANLVTRRYEPIASRDINNDAIIEIPIQIELPDSGYANAGTEILSQESDNAIPQDQNATQKLYLTKWVQFQGNSAQVTKVVSYSSINYSDGYMFFYPSEWIANEKNPKVTILSNQQERRWTFFARENGQMADELFHILTIPTDQWSKNPHADYTLIKENGSVVYVGRLSSDASQYGIDFDQLKSCISVIE